jgi:F0F1-type ATP synthase assembly protein I
MENRGFAGRLRIRRGKEAGLAGNGPGWPAKVPGRGREPRRRKVARERSGAHEHGVWRLPPKWIDCYNFAASPGGFACQIIASRPQATVPQAEQVTRVHDRIAASRRSALRAVVVQALVAALLAAVFLVQGPREALAAGVGGLALVLGNALNASMALGGIVPARVAFGRLLLGTLAKWLVAIAVFATALAVWRLPPLPMLVGLMAGMLAYLLALNILNNVNVKG